MNSYYIPYNKKDLIAWFKRNRSEWKGLSKKSKKQLYAIFYQIREGA